MGCGTNAKVVGGVLVGSVDVVQVGRWCLLRFLMYESYDCLYSWSKGSGGFFGADGCARSLRCTRHSIWPPTV